MSMMMKFIEKYKIGSLFMYSLLLLSATVWFWGCSTLKQKLRKKNNLNMIQSHEQTLKDQEISMDYQQRELMDYFGAYAVLILKDGFRFSADSGLVGKTALLSIRGEALSFDRLIDSSSYDRIVEGRIADQGQVMFNETESLDERERFPLSRWWWILLIPLIWFIWKRIL